MSTAWTASISLIAALCGCSANVLVTGAGDVACEHIPARTTSLEALTYAQECVPGAADAAIFEYAALHDGGAVSEGAFEAWHFVLMIDGSLSNVFVGHNRTHPNGLVEAHPLPTEDASSPQCEPPGVKVADSRSRIDAAAGEFFSGNQMPAATDMFHSASCLPWSDSPHLTVRFPTGEFCSDCDRSVEFDESGTILKTCWSKACWSGQTQFCCEG